MNCEIWKEDGENEEEESKKVKMKESSFLREEVISLLNKLNNDHTSRVFI
jgi:thymidine kinase